MKQWWAKWRVLVIVSVLVASLVGLSFLNKEEPRKNPIEEALRGVVIVANGESMGSGFFVDPRGYVLTNAHCVGSENKVYVLEEDLFLRSYPAEIVFAVQEIDLAVLKIEPPEGIKVLEFAEEDPKLGDRLYTIGHTLGLPYTVMGGTMSSFRLMLTGSWIFQHDTPINHGNSGGPLLNEEGKVVGVNFACVLGPAGWFEPPAETGLAFAISRKLARQFAESAIAVWEVLREGQMWLKDFYDRHPEVQRPG